MTIESLDAKPNHGRTARLARGEQRMEICVERDDDALLLARAVENFRIPCSREADVSYVNGIHALGSQQSDCRSRQSLVQEELHPTCGSSTISSSKEAAA